MQAVVLSGTQLLPVPAQVSTHTQTPEDFLQLSLSLSSPLSLVLELPLLWYSALKILVALASPNS